MSVIVDTLAPLILLIVLGTVLAHIKFLGREFMADLNRFAFWIALPALLFTSANHAEEPGSQMWRLLLVMIGATLLIILFAWGLGLAMGMPRHARSTFMQAGFRGNLTYIGIPVLAYSLGGDRRAMASAVIVMVLCMAFYNIMAVIVLHSGSQHGSDWKKALRSIATNPLLISGLLGLCLPFADIKLPLFVQRALDALAAAAVPIALLCIGGSLAVISLRGRRSWIVVAALTKVVALPVLVYFLTRAAGLGLAEQRTALVFACCPTAAASFVMAKQMGGDEALASGSIALSTILAAASLAMALWVTS